MSMLSGMAMVFAGLSAAILSVHLVRGRNEGDNARTIPSTTKLWLLLGLGVFPIAAAGSANVAGFEATQSRAFCGSCHVMIPHAAEASMPESTALSAIHARNASFGKDNCYTCHKDYGMYGFVLTKLGGMRHVYLYLTEYHSMPLEESRHAIRIMKPMPNSTCTSCHTTTTPGWNKVSAHAAALPNVRSGELSCASPGCHGFAHPSTKLGKELPLDGGAR